MVRPLEARLTVLIAARRQPWSRLALVLAMALAWLGASTGCAFGLPCSMHPPNAKACSGCCDDQPVPDPAKGGGCCAIDVSPTSGPAGVPVPPAFARVAEWVETLAAAALALPTEKSATGVGPPDEARSFAETILGRSRLEHAPPAGV